MQLSSIPRLTPWLQDSGQAFCLCVLASLLLFVARATQRLLQILDAMHRKSIPSFGAPMHFAYSDVKPQNICFSADWRPVLIDVDALKFQDNAYGIFLPFSLRCFCLA
jgi:hypothetical protein